MEPQQNREPFAARLYPLVQMISAFQRAIVDLFRRYFERAPGWVLLTTMGRKTGLPREVLLPCERFRDGMIVISTYDRRSNWIKNIERDPHVQVTCAGWELLARAEIVDDLVAKQSIVGLHPFFPAAPTILFHAVFLTVLRPLTIAALRRWVMNRPVVVIRIVRALEG
jgi:deazaflavin-dependent oxidoreductase (nitroreductase family)